MARRKSSKTAQTPESEIGPALDATAPPEAATPVAEDTPAMIVVEAPAITTPEAAVPGIAALEPEPAEPATADAPTRADIAEPAVTEPTVAETPVVEAVDAEAAPVELAEAEAPRVEILDIRPATSDAGRRAAQRSLFLPSLFSARAASLALAAALGAAVGALLPVGIDAATRTAAVAPSTPEPVAALRVSVSQLAAEISALKTAVGASSAQSHTVMTKVEQRLDEAEAIQTTIAERVARLADGAGLKPIPAATSREFTGSIKSDDATPPAAARGWVLWRVANGRALVQGNGGYYEVMAGSSLPGLGTVQKITRNDGRWMVVTQKGAILPPEG